MGDVNNPDFSKTVTITVTITDVNEPLVITSTDHDEEIFENGGTSEAILTVVANDPDGDTVAFSIPSDLPFTIGSDSGVITVSDTADIDVELLREEKTFNFDVTASANGNSTTTPVSIKVLDVNDETPVIAKEVYSGSINENSASGSTVIIAGDAISASDDDLTNPNNEIEYKQSSLLTLFVMNKVWTLLLYISYNAYHFSIFQDD